MLEAVHCCAYIGSGGVQNQVNKLDIMKYKQPTIPLIPLRIYLNKYACPYVYERESDRERGKKNDRQGECMRIYFPYTRIGIDKSIYLYHYRMIVHGYIHKYTYKDIHTCFPNIVFSLSIEYTITTRIAKSNAWNIVINFFPLILN